MNPRILNSSGWARGGSSELVRRAHPASGAEWNVQVVRGKVNGKCLWNACKALSLGLLLMVLGAAMATIGYYAEHLSIAQEVRGNHTVHVKNESRGFHLNNLSYAGPIVMGVGGFIVVAACVMTFEARDSAAKVVPARFKLSTTGPPPTLCSHAGHGSLRTSGSQTGATPTAHKHCSHIPPSDRRALTQSFMHFSRGLILETSSNRSSLKLPQQGSINRSPSAPDLVLERTPSTEQASPTMPRQVLVKQNQLKASSRRTFAACALLNPALLHRHALSVDEGAGNYRLSHESLHTSGSQGSMALDLHLDCPVTLRVRDRRRNPLKRQRRVEEEERQAQAAADNEGSRRSSHSCSPRLPSQYPKDFAAGGSQHFHHHSSITRRRSSNASDCTHRSRSRKRECQHNRGKLERAISSDSRLTGAIPKCHHHHNTPTQTSIDQEPGPGGSSSDTDIHKNKHRAMVHFSSHKR